MGTRGDGFGYRYIRQPFDETGQNGFYYQGKPLKSGEDIGNPYPNFMILKRILIIPQMKEGLVLKTVRNLNFF